jgi:Fe-S oxidoreductase
MIPTTIKFGPVPGWAILWVAFLAAVGACLWGVTTLVRLLLLGRPENRFDQIPKRLWRVAVYILAQRRMLEEPLVGIPHLLIFYGFLVFLLSTTGMLVKGLMPGLPIPALEENWLFAPIVDIFAVLVLAGLVVSSFRRFVLRPAGLQRTVDASIVNALIALLMASFLLAEAFRLMSPPSIAPGAPSGGLKAAATIGTPFGAWLAGALGGFPALAAHALTLYQVFWWSYILIVLGFLVCLPYSSHFHLVAAPFSVFFSRLEPPGRLRDAAIVEGGIGAGRLNELTWRQLLAALACAECGRCERACPSFQVGEPCSPRQLVHDLKVQLFRCRKARKAMMSGIAPAALDEELCLLEGLIGRNELWSCTTCRSCADRCPVFNEHLSITIDLRRRLVERGEIDKRLGEALRNLGRYGNSFGLSERKRAIWTQGLDFKPKDARKQPVQWLWYLGEYNCYHPALQPITRSLARVLQTAEVDYGILYEAERNSGNDTRRVGEEGLFELLRERNLAVLRAATFGDLFSTDPHVYNTLKNEYPNLNQGQRRIMHYTELLAELLAKGQLHPARRLGYRVTYHDPCHLGRYNGVYDAPRAVLQALGLQVKEMPRSRSLSFCCGGGGGRLWMEEIGEVHSRPSESRVREAASLDGVETLVVACPKDYVMFSDAVKTTGLEGKLAVKDLTELVAQAI